MNKRVKQIAVDFSESPQASIPTATRTWTRTKGAYRFFEHPKVTPEKIMASHQQAALERMRKEKTILMVQDTTALQYASQQAGSGLGSLGNRGDKALGLWLHSTLAMNEHGTSLGIVDVQTWVRDPKNAGIAARRKQRLFEDKESYRWVKSFEESVRLAALLPEAQVINIGDREGDIYELFAEASRHPQTGVLVRARHNRRLEGEEKLLDFVTRQAPAGSIEITVPRKPGVASHKVILEIRYTEVVLRPKKPDQIKLWVVEARQVGVPAKKGICWRLITNLPVSDLSSAVEKVRWYRLRWRIEEFHRVLKSGCKAEGRQLESLHNLTNVLMLDMIIAWRVMELTHVSRQSPDSPATDWLTKEEIFVLCTMHEKLASQGSLTLRHAVRAIAQWGGFLARKSDGEPGPSSLWLGLQRLNHYTTAFNHLSKVMGND